MPEQQVAGSGEHAHALEVRGLAYVARAAICGMEKQHLRMSAQAQVIADSSVYCVRGRERAAGRLELKEIGAAVFDEAQIRRAPNNAEAFENFRLGWSPIATVGDVKPKRVRRGARLKVPNDGALDCVFRTVAGRLANCYMSHRETLSAGFALQRGPAFSLPGPGPVH